MKIFTTLIPKEIDCLGDIKLDVIILIDILRASTTLIYALKSGARSIIPASTIEEAYELKRKFMHEKPLLCGERDGLIIPGFDLGNSPTEYTPENICGRMLIYTSTNGSVLMKKAEMLSENVLLMSLINISAVINYVESINAESILLACAGYRGVVSLEDTYAAGLFIEKICKRHTDCILDDGSLLSRILYEKYGENVESVLENAKHARYLGLDLGLAGDLKIAGRIDSENIVPHLIDGEIRVMDRHAFR